MMEPIRILHMIGSLNVGGSQSMIINLHRAIDRSKIQFDYIIDHSNHLYYEAEIKKLGGKIYSLPSFRGSNILSLRKIWKVFFKEHPEYKILHSHVRSYASLYLPIARKAGVLTVIHSHSTSNGHGFLSIIKSIMQYPLRYQADHFFACSKEAGTWLFGRNVVDGERFHMLQNAIDVEKYRFDQKLRDEYREKLGLGNKKTFIHIGRFHPAKNHVFLLNLFAEIHKRDCNTILLLAGDGELRSVIEKQIVNLNIQSSVLLLGCRNDVPNLLQASDCFLFPSVWEGLGMVAVEAQSVGVPCLCSTGIPKSVAVVPGLCHFISTDNISKWLEMACNSVPLYKDVSEYVKMAGYDINETAKKMESFYLNEWNRVVDVAT